MGAPPSPRPEGGLTGIFDLADRVSALEGVARERADRLLEVRLIEGITDPPPTLHAWLTKRFGSVDAVRRQCMVRVTNRATLEATIFAPLRARRPLEGPSAKSDLATEIEATAGDPFCNPERETPANSFGRIRGRRMTTGANAGLADAHHAVLVFDDHDPLGFDADLVADLLETGRHWAERARAEDATATHYLLVWNCLWRAGGSIIHGHAQALLGRGRPHAALDRFLRDAAAYGERFGADLVADLLDVHRDVGLARNLPGAVAVVAHLTPPKERELLVIGPPGMDERDPAFADAVWRSLSTLRDAIGVRSFNLALWRSPLDDGGPAMRPIVRIVDRGDPMSRPSDIGAMELYGTPIIASDPYEVIAALD